MRRSISVQSCESVPPAPAWMARMASRRSCSPGRGRVSSSGAIPARGFSTAGGTAAGGPGRGRAAPAPEPPVGGGHEADAVAGRYVERAAAVSRAEDGAYELAAVAEGGAGAGGGGRGLRFSRGGGGGGRAAGGAPGRGGGGGSRTWRAMASAGVAGQGSWGGMRMAGSSIAGGRAENLAPRT